MSCCGKGRQALRASGGGVVQPPRMGAPDYSVVMEYTGPTSMTVIGPTTGNEYRFGGTGVRLRVDARDRRQLLGVPHLKEAR